MKASEGKRPTTTMAPPSLHLQNIPGMPRLGTKDTIPPLQPITAAREPGEDAPPHNHGKGNGKDRHHVVVALADATSDSVAKELERNKDGSPKHTLLNAMVVFRHAPDLRQVVALDMFQGRTVVTRQPPWFSRGPYPRPVTDVDVTLAATWMARVYEVGTSADVVARVLDATADGNRIDPLSDYLKSLVWDKQERIGTWLTTYLGVEDTALSRAQGRAWLISAVARGLDPGCQADYTLVLEGKQGKGKSSALRALAGDEWFKDDIRDLHHKDAQEELRGKWILELAELDALSKSDVARTKRFLTQREDNYRPSYGRYTVQMPRRCVFAASTNEAEYLRDSTGNRRFWPVTCGDTINVDSIRLDRDHLWAEAVAAYLAGEKCWLDENMASQANNEQDARRLVDTWEAMLTQWLEEDHPGGITVLDAFARLDNATTPTPVLRQGRADQMRIGQILQQFGYKKQRLRTPSGGREYRYFKKPL